MFPGERKTSQRPIPENQEETEQEKNEIIK